MKNIYLFLAIIGTVLPLSQFYEFLITYGLDFDSYVQQLFINKISSFFAMDVLVSGVVMIVFIEHESRKRSVKNRWICYIGLFVAGIASGLSLFLYLRERNPDSL